MTALLGPDLLRARFAAAMSAMYAAEVPLYATLLAIVAQVNGAAGEAEPRVAVERHGAVRVGTAAELAQLGRVFAAMGMAPVGYYDLAPAGVPVHSTAFRPLTDEGLAANPFRIFCSLLRLDLLDDPGLRAHAAAILARRRILSPDALALAERAEAEGGLGDADADAFVAAVLETFRWRTAASVDAGTYAALRAAHPLVADVVAFPGPHINHLTPRTLDIDRCQAAMVAAGLPAKTAIEGPPRRRAPVLLRQTSFHALAEPIRFADEAGTHTARFGEIEQRGRALTPAGRARYDRALAANDFAGLPDDDDALRRDRLAYARYAATGRSAPEGETDLEALVAAGAVGATPITYEDFLPVSAAGIFRSNLGGSAGPAFAGGDAEGAFRAALDRPLHDPFALYAAADARSRAEVARIFGPATAAAE